MKRKSPARDFSATNFVRSRNNFARGRAPLGDCKREPVIRSLDPRGPFSPAFPRPWWKRKRFICQHFADEVIRLGGKARSGFNRGTLFGLVRQAAFITLGLSSFFLSFFLSLFFSAGNFGESRTVRGVYPRGKSPRLPGEIHIKRVRALLQSYLGQCTRNLSIHGGGPAAPKTGVLYLRRWGGSTKGW